MMTGRGGIAGRVMRLSRNAALASAATALVSMALTSGALAQNCSNNLTLASGLGPVTGTLSIAASGLSGANAVQGAVTAANTAFLTQSTAFVSAPGNAKPNSEGGGLWVRGVGGELTLNSNTQVSANLTTTGSSNLLGVAPGVGSTNCQSQLHQTFAGFQVGQDVANLNVSGWNLHLGTTAGYLETTGNLNSRNIQGGEFNSATQAPFVGTYGVATYGAFFIDGMVRYDYFQTDLNSPTANIFNQKLGAHGFTVAASTGYNWKVPNSNWFVEPSAGVVWSRESVDPFNTASPNAGNAFWSAGNYSGTTRINDIESVIGRAGVRVGTTIESNNMVFQPFAAVSVWHDFAGNLTANYNSVTNGLFVGGLPASMTASLSTSNIGTFGQYSVGLSGQIINTGWLGFARLDYRQGPHMEGISGTGGIRYQFTPGPETAAMPVKARVATAAPHDWSGFYIGGIGGAQYGKGHMDFPGLSSSEIRPAGALGGGTVGYNRQIGKWVYGLEGDVAWTNSRGSHECTPLVANVNGFGNPALFQTTCHDELNWVATATARLGYTWSPHTLLYVKGGAAWAGESFSATCNLGPLNGPGNINGATVQNCGIPVNNGNPTNALFNQASASDTRLGWTIGFGTEFALTSKWSAKGEFDYLDFGSKSLTLSDGSAVNTTQRVAQGKIGLNYKLSP